MRSITNFNAISPLNALLLDIYDFGIATGDVFGSLRSSVLLDVMSSIVTSHIYCGITNARVITANPPVLCQNAPKKRSLCYFGKGKATKVITATGKR